MDDAELTKEARDIRDAARIAEFLADEVVQNRLARLRADYDEEWRTGASTADREAVWFKRRALDDLETELRIVVDAGQAATHAREVRERRSPRGPKPRH
jgi:hypothetical protein